MLQHTWSAYQQAIFCFIEIGTGNAIVEAVAGSGKSTTLVECARRAKGTSLFLAFNKPIADELKKRGVNARTFHSLTYTAVTKDRRTYEITQGKLTKVLNENVSDATAKKYGSFAVKLVGLGSQSGIGVLVPDEMSAWMEIIEHHSLELEDNNANVHTAIELASDLLGWSNKSKLIDYDDLLYFAVKDGLPLPRHDLTLVDEAQDTNAIQRAILRKIMRPNSRLVAVGDPGQAIYGFRGADSESLNMIASEFSCIRLPLTVSYRCPVKVVEYARQFTPHIEAAPGAAEGEVVEMGDSWTKDTFCPGDLIVCRTTKPIVSLAYQMLKAGRPARIQGREIGSGINLLINKMDAQNVDELRERLEAYRDRESEKAIGKGDEAKAEGIKDRVETILALIGELPESDRTIARLQDNVRALFSSKSAEAILLSTIHRAKGLEAETVYWLNRSDCPPKWARDGWQMQQEINLCYVATTRAKSRLVLIEE